MQRINPPPHTYPTPPRQRRQRGITLLESLIALVISALGILGIVGVQMRTLSDTQTSVRRAQAIRLVEDLSERMRVNPNALTQLEDFQSDFDDEDPPSNFCEDGCTPAEQVAFDVAVWKQTVKNLPLGQAQIFLAPGETVADNRRQLGVIISWRENEAHDDEDYTNPVNAVTATNVSGGVDVDNACPAERVCHLQYIPVPARCAPYAKGSGFEYYCS